MPFLSESITNPSVLRLSATAQCAHHIQIRPLSLPFVPRNLDQHHGIEMRTTFMPADYRNAAEAIRSVPVRSDDVWVIGYPGSGTEIVRMLIEELLYQEGQSSERLEAAPLLEQTGVCPHLQRSTQRPSWERILRLPTDRPRVIRSHLPYLLLPVALWRQQPRIVYVAQDPGQVAADYYREYRLLHGYKGTSAEFAQLWRNGHLTYGALAEHAQPFDALQAGGVRNVINVKFDVDSRENLFTLIEQVARLLEVETDDEQFFELEQWIQAQLKMETSFRADVATMDKHFKRTATVDFDRVPVADLE